MKSKELATALRRASLTSLARRAEEGEFDAEGPHVFPRVALINALQVRAAGNDLRAEAMLARVRRGEFDA